MVTIIERKVGETGNPITGYLNNESNTLMIPAGATVTLSATDTATGARVIDAAPVTVVDAPTRLVTYAPSDADVSTARTLDLEFAIIPTGLPAKPTFVPDKRSNRLLLVIGARIAA